MPKGVYTRREETKEKIRKANLRCNLSEETLRKRSEAQKGRVSPMKGKHHSEAAREKNRQASLKRNLSKETLIKRSESATGKKHTEESKEKNRQAHLGDKSPSWKGGITPLREQIRSCFKYRQWRSDIFTRDGFTCQECGAHGLYLEAHHLKSFSNILAEYKIKTIEEALNCEELWNINNGITLDIRRMFASLSRVRTDLGVSARIGSSTTTSSRKSLLSASLVSFFIRPPIHAFLAAFWRPFYLRGGDIMNFILKALSKIGSLAQVLSIQAAADTNADGVIDGNEQLAAGLKMLPSLAALAGAKIAGNTKLDDPEEQEAFISELDALLVKYGILKEG